MGWAPKQARQNRGNFLSAQQPLVGRSCCLGHCRVTEGQRGKGPEASGVYQENYK